MKSESQSLYKSAEHQGSSEKALQKDVNQKYEQEKKEKKEDGALNQATTEIGKANSQDIKSRDKASKTDKIKKQAIKKEVPPIKHRYTTPETRVSNDLNDLREKYRQERGKRQFIVVKKLRVSLNGNEKNRN